MCDKSFTQNAFINLCVCKNSDYFLCVLNRFFDIMQLLIRQDRKKVVGSFDGFKKSGSARETQLILYGDEWRNNKSLGK